MHNTCIHSIVLLYGLPAARALAQVHQEAAGALSGISVQLVHASNGLRALIVYMLAQS